MTLDYKQAQREAEAASRRVYRPQPTKQGFVRDQDGAVYVFAGKQARVIKPRLTGRAARWLRRIMERAKASLEKDRLFEQRPGDDSFTEKREILALVREIKKGEASA